MHHWKGLENIFFKNSNIIEDDFENSLEVFMSIEGSDTIILMYPLKKET